MLISLGKNSHESNIYNNLRENVFVAWILPADVAKIYHALRVSCWVYLSCVIGYVTLSLQKLMGDVECLLFYVNFVLITVMCKYKLMVT